MSIFPSTLANSVNSPASAGRASGEVQTHARSRAHQISPVALQREVRPIPAPVAVIAVTLTAIPASRAFTAIRSATACSNASPESYPKTSAGAGAISFTNARAPAASARLRIRK